MILQLTPPIPLWHVKSGQACDAIIALDYSVEHDLMFVVILRSGEIWVCRSSELRGQENVTLGRERQTAEPQSPNRSQPQPLPLTGIGWPPGWFEKYPDSPFSPASIAAGRIAAWEAYRHTLTPELADDAGAGNYVE
jgi:hypothetical protein